MPSSADRRTLGLRERKRAQTRVAVRAHALRLFLDQGYAATTVQQIIEAADVSESTFFRVLPHQGRRRAHR
jgi:AcrR family transcriptional regulator